MAATLTASPTVTALPPTAAPATALATATSAPATTTATAEPSVTATATVLPSATPTVEPTAIPTVAYVAAAPRVELTGLTHAWQTWNNCGPVSLVMNMSYYGKNLTQAEVGKAIRPNKEDKHAGIGELAAYAEGQGFRTVIQVDGTADKLKLFLSNGLPVMMPTWHVNPKGEGMGHYRVLTGYDDAKREWIVYDSLESRGVSAKGPYLGVRIAYDEFDQHWAVFNRVYLVLYPEKLDATVRSIIGDDLNPQTMWQRSLARAEEAVKQQPDEAFAWFTLGTNLVAHGRWQEAATAYDHARMIGLPYRMLWYQHGPLQAYYETGRYDEAIALADATIKVTADVEELHYWRGRALAAVGNVPEARKALETAIAKRPNFPDAVDALNKLGQ